MASEFETISLIEHVGETGFSASLAATYNCYFPFYEEVVLRRMVAAGCTHNVLMVDATRCAEAFASDDLRPRRAGRDYTLIPVTVGGAFHPKILLRVGKARGALFVGSHNMTLAGFGVNDEVTSVFRAERASLRTGSAPFRWALEYLAAFVPETLPALVEAYQGLKVGVSWLEGPLALGEQDRLLFSTSPTSPGLWPQLLPLVPKDVETAFVCAPFFDPKLAFLRRILTDVRPRQLIVGIDPASAEIDPDEARRLTEVRFVNVAEVEKVNRPEGAKPYLHAKMLWMRSAHHELLVTGSANASVAAFLAPSSQRNAEAVVADRRRGAGVAIGIPALMSAPPITSTEWTAVGQRLALRSVRSEETSRRVLLSVPTPSGFRTQSPLPHTTILQAMDDGGRALGEAHVREASNCSDLDAVEAVRDEASFLETSRDGEGVLVMVHRGDEVAKHVGSDTRKALRKALGALDEDPAQLEALLNLTERVIFDSDEVVRARPLRMGSATAPFAEPEETMGSLALDAMGRRTGRRRQSLASGDIVVLLDALTRRLGEGLETTAADGSEDSSERIGADDEDGGELAREELDHFGLAKACRAKARRLVTRMERQLDVAAQPELARRGVVQLAAVLGVIRMLRMVEQRPDWRTKRLTLVDRHDQQRLVEKAILSLTWGSASIGERALIEAACDAFEELSIAIGLLAWLAWDVKVDVAGPLTSAVEIDEQKLFSAQLFAALAPWLAHNARAISILGESVARTPQYRVDGTLWVFGHLAIAERIAGLLSTPAVSGTVIHVRPGDIVILSERFDPRIRIVLAVTATAGDVKVTFFDLAEPGNRRSFLAAKVSIIPWLNDPSLGATA